MSFDARQAKLLVPGAHIIVDDAPGLRLVARASRKSWVYRYKHSDGRMKQQVIGQWPAISYAAALGIWESMRVARESGRDVATALPQKSLLALAKKAKADDFYSVRNLIDDYLRGHININRKPKGVAEVTRLLTGYTNSISDKPAASIRRSDAFDLIEHLATRAPVLAMQLRNELGAAWDYALDAGRIPDETPNWWRLVLRGKIRSRGQIIAGKHAGVRKRVLSDAEMTVLLRWLPNFTALIEDILTMYIFTCTRGAEIVAIEGREVCQEADGWWWTIPKEKTKGARHAGATDHRVPLVGRALDSVLRRKEAFGDGYLFPPMRDAQTPHTQQKAVGVALWIVRPTTVTDRLPRARAAILPIERFAPHDLRRTARTKLAALGCPEAVAEAILGHLPPGIVGVYNRHAYDRERRAWLEILAAHWESLLS
ncbi:alpha/beta hydrolase [Lampropedia aestuarii]|uniref:Alpha/beta hydrolase n=2 Tax=Lampropedia aestuarii TaxID=2562762 RepID=A0A4S5BQ92_9BURK|nr:alpha/beta hydrolase [Lampropedia aestuarii]